MNEQTENKDPERVSGSRQEPVVMCAVALLFQKDVPGGYQQKVRCSIVEHKDGDDTYDHRAKAERYFRNHKDLKDELDGFHVIGWHTAMTVDAENT